jgi:hypothetical protein
MQAWRYPAMLDFIRARDLPIHRLVGTRRPLADGGEVLASMGAFAPLGVTVLEP